METENDYTLKDEGDFITVSFLTDDAKKIIKSEMNDDSLFHGDDNVLKLDIHQESKSNVIIFLLSHGLRGVGF